MKIQITIALFDIEGHLGAADRGVNTTLNTKTGFVKLQGQMIIFCDLVIIRDYLHISHNLDHCW